MEFIGSVMVSDVFAIDGRCDETFELIWNAELCDRPYWRSEDGYEIRAVLDYEPESMSLISPTGDRCGFIMKEHLWIDPDHRGRGLGAELVLALSDSIQDSPTADVSAIGFAPEGHYAFFKAWKMAVRRAHARGEMIAQSILDDAIEDHVPSFGFEQSAIGYSR